MRSFSKEYYTHVAPHIIVDEVLTESFNKKYYNIAEDGEELFNEARTKIFTHIKVLYGDIEEVLNLFNPIKELTANNLIESIDHYLDMLDGTFDFVKHSYYIKTLRSFIKYIDQMPYVVRYSLLTADLRDIKAELKEICVTYVKKLLLKIETQCTSISMNTVVKFNTLYRKLNKRLNCPEDIEIMNNIKLEIVKETALIEKKMEENNQLVFYMLDMDDIIDDELTARISELIARERRFKRELEQIEIMHGEQRVEIETEHKKQKKRIELESRELTIKVNGLDKGLQLEKYETVLALVSELRQECLFKMDEVENSLKDEEFLFSFRQHNFEAFRKTLTKIERFYTFWSNALGFYNHRREVIVNFSENIDFSYSLQLAKEVIEVITNEKTKAQENEEDFIKYSGFILDELAIFVKVSGICKEVFNDKMFNDEIIKRTSLLCKEKKVDYSSKQILYRILDMRDLEDD